MPNSLKRNEKSRKMRCNYEPKRKFKFIASSDWITFFSICATLPLLSTARPLFLSSSGHWRQWWWLRCWSGYYTCWRWTIIIIISLDRKGFCSVDLFQVPTEATEKTRRRNAPCVSFVAISPNKSKWLEGRSGECVYHILHFQPNEKWIKFPKWCTMYGWRECPHRKRSPRAFFLSLTCRYSCFVARIKRNPQSMIKWRGVRDVCTSFAGIFRQVKHKRQTKTREINFVEFLLFYCCADVRRAAAAAAH